MLFTIYGYKACSESLSLVPPLAPNRRPDTVSFRKIPRGQRDRHRVAKFHQRAHPVFISDLPGRRNLGWLHWAGRLIPLFSYCQPISFVIWYGTRETSGVPGMAENRFSFTAGEMDTLKAVLDFALERLDERLQSGHRTPSETEVFALRLSRTKGDYPVVNRRLSARNSAERTGFGAGRQRQHVESESNFGRGRLIFRASPRGGHAGVSRCRFQSSLCLSGFRHSARLLRLGALSRFRRWARQLLLQTKSRLFLRSTGMLR